MGGNRAGGKRQWLMRSETKPSARNLRLYVSDGRSCVAGAIRTDPECFHTRRRIDIDRHVSGGIYAIDLLPGFYAARL